MGWFTPASWFSEGCCLGGRFQSMRPLVFGVGASVSLSHPGLGPSSQAACPPFGPIPAAFPYLALVIPVKTPGGFPFPARYGPS